MTPQGRASTTRGTMRLYHYHPMSDEVYRVPVVLVMSLISKPYILDLTPGFSFVEFLLKQGFDVFMIDWGVPRPEDTKLRLEDYTLDFIPACIEKIQEATGETDVSFIGYCMGGLLSLIYGGLHADAPMTNLVTIATPGELRGHGAVQAVDRQALVRCRPHRRHARQHPAGDDVPLVRVAAAGRSARVVRAAVGQSLERPVRQAVPADEQVDERPDPVPRRMLPPDDEGTAVGEQADEGRAGDRRHAASISS